MNFDWLFPCRGETLRQFRHINHQLKNIMSKISEFATAQKAHNEKIGTAIDGIVSDINDLKAKIDELQNSQGEVTPEDQALLDELQAQAASIADKLTALDEQTPPTVPPVTP